MLGNRGRSAVRDVGEHRAPDRVQPPVDVARQVDERGVRAGFVDHGVELVVVAPEREWIHPVDRGRHPVGRVAHAVEIGATQLRSGERGRVTLEQRDHGQLLLEQVRVSGRYLGAGIRPVDDQSLGLEPADRLPHGQRRDSELGRQRVDHDPEAGAVGAAQDPLADRVVDTLLLGGRALRVSARRWHT